MMERQGDEWRIGKMKMRGCGKWRNIKTENQSLNVAEGWTTIYHPHKSSRVSGEMLVEEGHAGKNRLRANEEKSCHSCFRRKEVNQINYNY